MENEKKPEFVVSDRRKFTSEGEPRPDVEATSPRTQPTTPSAPPPPSAPTTLEAPPILNATPAAAPRETGYDAEHARTSFGGQKMEFIHLLDMLVQTAMLYAGALDTGAGQRKVDIVGLRQMIDLIGVLEEKTKGNLTEQEASELQNTIFQLRMTYMELVKMIERQATQSAPGEPESGLLK